MFFVGITGLYLFEEEGRLFLAFAQKHIIQSYLILNQFPKFNGFLFLKFSATERILHLIAFVLIHERERV